AGLEVDDLDHAVALKAERAGEVLSPQFDEPFDQVDLADFPFQLHLPALSMLYAWNCRGIIAHAPLQIVRASLSNCAFVAREPAVFPRRGPGPVSRGARR